MRSGGRMAEVVSFAVLSESDKTLLVWELSSGPTAEALHHSLFTVFSQLDLLYSLRVFPNAAVARPGFYGIIKFYSARDAHRAQMACHEKHLFQKSPVQVRLGTKHKADQHQALALNSSQCQELANYYFGFNGWSKRIIKVNFIDFLWLIRLISTLKSWTSERRELGVGRRCERLLSGRT
ncbi:RAD52 motif-containing protein 1 [Mirounga leonina]|uniref:RAD52 motif-containing protein 1 n=1 Tax=Mirounga leonina TaxID=9715 RepID=UPI00156C5660|nr:RAD52 motif-containing protein 1 [Mirounga leonina]